MIYSTSYLEARLYFLHVPKTGGTTLRLLLASQLSAEEIYPYRNTRSKVGPVKEELVSGHFPYWFCKNLDSHFEESFKITILREPVERYLSFLRAKKKADITLPDLESVFRLRQSPDKKYSEGLIDNAFCRYLTSDPQLEGEALLAKAKEVLEEFDCVIIFDHFTSEVIELFKRLEIDLVQEDVPKINTTKMRPVINKKLLEEIKKLNELDIQLYAYAKNHLCKKNTLYPLRKSSFNEIITKTSSVNYTFNLPLFGRGWTCRETLDMKKLKNTTYRWVMDHPAKIYFPLEVEHDYLISFNARSLTKECIPRIKVGGQEIELVRLNTHLFSLYQGIISRDLIASDFTEVEFYSDKAFQYRNIYPSQYNRNYPLLSFALNQIRIECLNNIHAFEGGAGHHSNTLSANVKNP